MHKKLLTKFKTHLLYINIYIYIYFLKVGIGKNLSPYNKGHI